MTSSGHLCPPSTFVLLCIFNWIVLHQQSQEPSACGQPRRDDGLLARNGTFKKSQEYTSYRNNPRGAMLRRAHGMMYHSTATLEYRDVRLSVISATTVVSYAWIVDFQKYMRTRWTL